MSDQEAAPLIEGQAAPESASPEGTGATEPQIPAGYLPEKDYKELQSWATRVAQENKEFTELSQALQDPEHPRFEEALGRFGLEVPQQEQQAEEFDPYEKRIAELEAKYAQQEQQAQSQQQQAAIDAALYDGLNAIQTELGRDLQEKEVDLLAAYAVLNPRDDGLPNVQASWELYHSLIDQEKGQVFKNRKNTPKAPAGGVEAGKQTDLSTRAAREAALNELWVNSLESDAA